MDTVVKDEVLKMHGDGAFNADIVARTGLTLKQVQSILTHSGLRSNRDPVRIRHIDMVKPLHAKGLLNSDIMERTGLTRFQVGSALTSLGLYANRIVTSKSDTTRRNRAGIKVGRLFDDTTPEVRDKIETYAAKHGVTMWAAVDELLTPGLGG